MRTLNLYPIFFFFAISLRLQCFVFVSLVPVRRGGELAIGSHNGVFHSKKDPAGGGPSLTAAGPPASRHPSHLRKQNHSRQQANTHLNKHTPAELIPRGRGTRSRHRKALRHPLRDCSPKGAAHRSYPRIECPHTHTTHASARTRSLTRANSRRGRSGRASPPKEFSKKKECHLLSASPHRAAQRQRSIAISRSATHSYRHTQAPARA